MWCHTPWSPWASGSNRDLSSPISDRWGSSHSSASPGTSDETCTTATKQTYPIRKQILFVVPHIRYTLINSPCSRWKGPPVWPHPVQSLPGRLLPPPPHSGRWTPHQCDGNQQWWPLSPLLSPRRLWTNRQDMPLTGGAKTIWQQRWRETRGNREQTQADNRGEPNDVKRFFLVPEFMCILPIQIPLK